MSEFSVWQRLLILTVITAAAWIGYQLWFYRPPQNSNPAAIMVSSTETTSNNLPDDSTPILTQGNAENLEGVLICPEIQTGPCSLGFQTMTGDIYFLRGQKTVIDYLYDRYHSNESPLIRFFGNTVIFEGFENQMFFQVTKIKELP